MPEIPLPQIGVPAPGPPAVLRTAVQPGGQSARESVFQLAVAGLEDGLAQQRRDRPELAFEDEPAPRRLAPYAAAVAASVLEGDNEVGWGKFVLLYDPAGQAGWAGQFRIIAYIRAELDPEIAADTLIAEVGWSWLLEALDARATGYGQTSGTVTRVVTEGFGAKQDEPMSTGFELRASWSPAGDGEQPALDGHVAAWCDALCMAAGLPPAGVTALRGADRRPQR
ncbi:MAG: DUF3000 family protein [Streptosporangiaceae bacterium]